MPKKITPEFEGKAVKKAEAADAQVTRATKTTRAAKMTRAAKVSRAAKMTRASRAAK